MSMPSSLWTTDVFGEQAADARCRVGQGLRNMQANAQAAQEQAASRTTRVYGTSRYENQYERLQDELKQVPGARAVKPFGFSYELMLIGKGLIYPFRYSNTKSDVRSARIPSQSRLVRELFTFAPAPKHTQVPFDLDFGPAVPIAEPRGALATVPEGTQLVLVPFACNASELLEAYWGIAALGMNRQLEWATDPEPLHLPQEVTSYTLRPISIPGQVTAHTGFAEGLEPTLTLSSRAASDQALHVPVQTEAEPIEDQSSEDDATH
ncbi:MULTISPECIES: hypothetical protein [unclassified Streptomyces]|uniref:hypothetical protein n=1 Tax=unclassified Streptomyces TaxID=2593676 RepID=UPI00093C8969|nr:hypothetical protein [Streptomyces sp. TSRI0281]